MQRDALPSLMMAILAAGCGGCGESRPPISAPATPPSEHAASPEDPAPVSVAEARPRAAPIDTPFTVSTQARAFSAIEPTLPLQDQLTPEHFVLRARVLETGHFRRREGDVTSSCGYAALEPTRFIQGAAADIDAASRARFATWWCHTPTYDDGEEGITSPLPVFSLEGQQGRELLVVADLPRVGGPRPTSEQTPAEFERRYGDAVVRVIAVLEVAEETNVRGMLRRGR